MSAGIGVGKTRTDILQPEAFPFRNGGGSFFEILRFKGQPARSADLKRNCSRKVPVFQIAVLKYVFSKRQQDQGADGVVPEIAGGSEMDIKLFSIPETVELD